MGKMGQWTDRRPSSEIVLDLISCCSWTLERRNQNCGSKRWKPRHLCWVREAWPSQKPYTESKWWHIHQYIRSSYQRDIQREENLPCSWHTWNKRGHLDSTLLKSEFKNPTDLLFIGPSTLMVADNKIRLLDLQMDKVTTLNICSGCKRLTSPSSLLMNNHSLYIGDFSGIQGFRRKSLHVFQSCYRDKNMKMKVKFWEIRSFLLSWTRH